MAAHSRQLSTAAERREAVIEAAIPFFAERGLHGTPTTEVARAAGISQAYLFRLFPTKLDLYVATAERCFERLGETFRVAGEQALAAGEDPLGLMGAAFVELIDDRTMLTAMLQAFAVSASGEPVIRDTVREGYGRLFELVQQVSGATDDELRDFFAHGMLLTVMAGLDAASLQAHWAEVLTAKDGDG